MRVSDVLQIRWSDIYDDRLHYRMNKNDKLLSLKLPEKLLPILKQYDLGKASYMDFIFPEMKKAKTEKSTGRFCQNKDGDKKIQ